MFYRKIYFLIALNFISSTVSAADSIWKKSHDLEAAGEYEKAADVIKSKVKINDEYAVLRYASLKYKQGEFNESIEYYKKAIKLNLDSLDAKLGITLPYMAQGRWRQVDLYTSQVLVLSDLNQTAHLRQMMAEEGMKKWTTLNRHSTKLVKSYPEDVELYRYYAYAKSRHGDTNRAKIGYYEVLKRDPDNAEANEYVEDN